MKSMKTLALGLGLMLAAASAQALVDLSAFGGYAGVGMSDVNDILTKSASGGSAATLMNSGFYAGAQAGITLMPFLKIGPRFEYVQSGQGKVGNYTVDANLSSYELGISSDVSLPLVGLSVEGGVWGGYGMAGTKLSNSLITDSSTGSGSGFVANVGAQLRYKLVAGLFIGVDLGYRMANIANVNADKTDSNYGSKAGDPFFKKTDGSQASVDFSGLNAGGTIGWNF